MCARSCETQKLNLSVSCSVEHEIDKKLGITSKEDVMQMGIAKYNEE